MVLSFLLIFKHAAPEENPIRMNVITPVTCVAVHPHESTIATGHFDGVINLWFLNFDLSVSCKTQMHWHAHAVGALTFTSEGTYILSGGEEAVLVVWQTATNNKRFLPRLSSPIIGLSLDNKDSLYCVMGSDNSIRVIDSASFSVTQTIQGLKVGHFGQASNCSVMSLDPISKLVFIFIYIYI